MSDYSLPDPLPERLPGESHSAYRRRVIPGFTEWYELYKPWRRIKDGYVRASRRRGDPPESIPQALDTAWDEWCEQSPDDAYRFAELSEVMPWVVFVPGPVVAEGVRFA